MATPQRDCWRRTSGTNHERHARRLESQQSSTVGGGFTLNRLRIGRKELLAQLVARSGSIDRRVLPAGFGPVPKVTLELVSRLALRTFSPPRCGMAPQLQSKQSHVSSILGNTMGVFFHVTAVAPFFCLFLLGKLTLGGCGKLTEARRRAHVPPAACV